MQTIKYEAMAGEDIDKATKVMVRIARANEAVVTTDFNGIIVEAKPDSDGDTLADEYRAECKRQSDAYRASPEYAERVRQAAEEDARKRAGLEAVLAACPGIPTMRDADRWRKTVDNNRDGGYGEAVIRYASLWARLMEGALAGGRPVAVCAQDLSRLADVEGITGAMYGMARSLLVQCWAHGEELAKAPR